MCLVRDHHLLTNMPSKTKVASLQAHQARFLAQMETCSTWEIVMLDLVDRQTQVILRQIIMNIPDPSNPKCKLFHAVNKMFIQDGYIFCFHLSRSQQAREVVGQIISLLDGPMGRNDQCIKIQQILYGQHYWMIEECLVGHKYVKCGYQGGPGNGKYPNIWHWPNFPEMKVELEMSGAMTPADMIAKIQDDLLSTGSISTFCTATTRASQVTTKSTSCAKTNKGNDTSTTDTNSVFSLVTFSENDLSILLAWHAHAMTLQQTSSNKPNPKEQTQGQNASKGK